MSSFGKRLRECREAKGLSQQDLAKLLETSYTVIGKYERDKMKPSIDVARKLAKMVDTTVGYLLRGKQRHECAQRPCYAQAAK